MRIALGLLALAALACSGEPPEPDPASPPETVMLPDACYGEWEFAGSSGGIDGRGTGETRRIRMTLTRENVMETRTPEGEVTSRTFTVRRGKSIFSADPGWLIRFGDGDMESEVRLAADGRLTISENVYDGFSAAWKPVVE